MNCRILIVAVLLFSASLTAMAEDWPGWRGPTYQGISTEKNVPVRWSATENVAWKTPIAGQGWSSPIVFGDRVFLTATSPDGVKSHVVCLDRVRGSILWDKEVFEQTPKNKAEKNSYATPTPCTDGRRLYAVFGDGSFVALDYDGQVVWLNREQEFYSQHGLGTSPILYGDLLLMARDGSSEGEDKKLGWQKPWYKGVLLALDKETGKIRWQGLRGQSRIAHVVPNVYFLSESGDSTIIEAGRQYKLIAKSTVGEKCQASYAVSRGRIFIRTERNLFCIGADKSK